MRNIMFVTKVFMVLIVLERVLGNSYQSITIYEIERQKAIILEVSNYQQEVLELRVCIEIKSELKQKLYKDLKQIVQRGSEKDLRIQFIEEKLRADDKEKRLNCSEYQIVDLIGRKTINGPKHMLKHHKDISTWPEKYRYGNWCGYQYGGLNNNCQDVCAEDLNQPTEECIACNPPIDYLDEQCMYHDFCLERFQRGMGGSEACKHSGTFSTKFITPCVCSINLIDALSLSSVMKHCDSVSCYANSYIVEHAFNNPLMPCGCQYKECQIIPGKDIPQCFEIENCLNPQECEQFGGS